MSSRFDVVIVGAGMSGASLALALAEGGIRSALLDPSELTEFSKEQPYELRASAITPASRNLLANLGVWNDIERARVSPFSAMRVYDAHGTDAIEFAASDIGEAALGYIVENLVITNSLRAAVDANDNVEWIRSHVTGFSLEEDDAIVTLENGQVLLAQLLVGADGVNSFVREQAGIEQVGGDYGDQAIVAVVEGRVSGQTVAWQRFTEQDILAFLPLQNNLHSIVWSVSKQRANNLLACSNAEFCSALQGLSQKYIGNATLVSERASFPLRGIQAEEYVRSRLALVGDAAHSVHPLAGQGANLGFQDVAVLSDVLRKSDRDLGSLQYLSKYQRRRAGENALMQKSLEFLRTVYCSNDPLASEVRKIGLGLVSRLGPAKNILIKHASGFVPGAPALLKRYR